MTDYVGAIDQGTTGTRFVVFDEDARIVASAYERHEQHYPEPGWVEHDPTEIWENTVAVVGRTLTEADLSGEAISGVGITNQRETTVLWDRSTGEPVANAIVWQDRRTTDRIEALEAAGKSEWIRERTGLHPDAYFTATKAEWLLEHAGDATVEDDLVLGTIDSWLIWKLTGTHVTDVTNASRTMLFDVLELSWDDELLAEFGIPRSVLPEVRPSVDENYYGHTDPDGVFDASVPVASALGDQQAALFGQTCFDAGDVKNTYGTGSFVLVNTGSDPVTSEHGLLTTVAFQRSGEAARYALEGSIFATGAAIEWLSDVGLIEDPEATESLATAVDSTDGVYLVPAFSGLGAPHWDGRARGTIVGLTRGTRREHLARATLESIAYQTRDVLEAMADDADLEWSRLRVDGGAVANETLCQLQADLLQTIVARPVVTETTALGAAFAAGLAADVWDSMDHLRGLYHLGREFEPTIEPAAADRRYERWGGAVARSRDWAREE